MRFSSSASCWRMSEMKSRAVAESTLPAGSASRQVKYTSTENLRIALRRYRQFGERNLPTLDVVDRGPGIPSKVAAQIFEPFFTTHELGTGLGLYLAREMCIANLASLEYLPIAGGGSCFRITFAPSPSPTLT